MHDQCPHCNKIHCIPDMAFWNVEFYGDNTFNVPCKHCRKMMKVSLRRRVYVSAPPVPLGGHFDSDF